MKNFKLICFLFIIFFLFFITKYSPLKTIFTLDNLFILRKTVADFGSISFIIYIFITVLCCVFMVPIVPIAVLSSILYGPVKGTILASFATAIGSSVSFLISRYFLHDYIKIKMESSKILREIYDKTEKYGFIMLITTRLVPAFPFGIQNYVYGITNIKFTTFMFYSWLSMIPATCAVCLSCDIITLNISR